MRTRSRNSWPDHAKISAAYDPRFDDPSERFAGPDSAMMEAAAKVIRSRGETGVVWSDFGSGCYRPLEDKDARRRHDRLLAEIAEYRAAISLKPGA